MKRKTSGVKKLRTIRDLSFDDKNANRGTERGRALVGHSLERYGAGRSVLADRHGKLIAGNKTVEQALVLNKKIRVIPTSGDELVVVQRTDLDMDTDAAARELAIADNRAGELGLEWDADMLDLLKDEGVNLAEMFSDAELEDLATLHEPLTDERDSEALAEIFNRVDELQKKWKVERGQIWQVGDHRIMCGDARAADDVTAALAGGTINVAVTSPPYAKRREYDKTSGFTPIPPDDYVEWFRPVSENIAAHFASDGSFFLNLKPSGEGLDTELYVFDLVLAHARQWGWHFATEFCWERGGVPKQVALRFKNQFEPIYQLTRGRWKIRPMNVRKPSDSMIIPIGEGAGDTAWDKHQGGRRFFKPSQIKKLPHGTRGALKSVQGAANYQPGAATTDGWAFPGNRLPTMAGSHEATGHAAAFPVGLPAFFIRAYSDEGDLVYEPFAGSGSTLVAAHQNDRRGVGMEISPKYCALIIERLALLGLRPKLTTAKRPKAGHASTTRARAGAAK